MPWTQSLTLDVKTVTLTGEQLNETCQLQCKADAQTALLVPRLRIQLADVTTQRDIATGKVLVLQNVDQLRIQAEAEAAAQRARADARPSWLKAGLIAAGALLVGAGIGAGIALTR